MSWPAFPRCCVGCCPLYVRRSLLGSLVHTFVTTCHQKLQNPSGLIHDHDAQHEMAISYQALGLLQHTDGDLLHSVAGAARVEGIALGKTYGCCTS